MEMNTISSPAVYLGTIRPDSQAGELEADRNAAGGELNIGGLVYQRGVGTRTSSELVYKLTDDCERFEAWVGLDSASARGSAVFQVHTDGELAFDSGRLDYVAQGETVNANRPVGVKVPLAGVKELRLSVSGPGSSGQDTLADWGDARLLPPGTPLFATPSAPPAGTLAPTPPMGWNNWNNFGTEIDEQLIRDMTDALVAAGMRDLGYCYMCLDDGWQDPDRGDRWNTARFPRGVKALGDFIHSKGLRFGIYTRPAWVRGQEPGVAGAFAEWGVDYVKYDFSDVAGEQANRRMVEAVRKAGRPVVFNVCEWGKNRPWEWGSRIDGQSWRVTYDVVDAWHTDLDSNRGLGFMKAVDQTEALGRFQRPGRWNDPDMLVVGLGGKGFVKGGGCSHAEYRTHFGLWSLLSAPLLVACDLRNMDEETKATLTNCEVIAIDQDPLGVPACRVKKRGDVEIWQKLLHGGDVAVGLLNRGDKPTVIVARWRDLYLSGRYRVRDLWTGADLRVHDAAIEQEVGSHELALLRLSPAT